MLFRPAPAIRRPGTVGDTVQPPLGSVSLETFADFESSECLSASNSTRMFVPRSALKDNDTLTV